MKNKFSYEEKLKVLGVLAVLLLIICVKFPFYQTLQEYRRFKVQKENVTVQNHPLRDGSNDGKSSRIDLVLNRYALDTADNAKNLLGIISSYCQKHDLRLKEYRPLGKREVYGRTVLCRMVTFEGSFAECLKVNYELETQYECGRIGSVWYKSYFNPADKSTHLNCIFYILNVTNDGIEK